MIRRINVDQNQMVVVPLKQENIGVCLTTSGVSTCICLLAEGRVGDTPYVAMYHWDGFSVGFNFSLTSADDEVDRCIKSFAQKIYCKMNPYPMRLGTRPVLHTFSLIGGERATSDLSGTEREVEALGRQAEAACKSYFITSSDTTYVYEHYLTSGVQCLRIDLDAFGATWTLDQAYDSEDENDLNMDENDSGSVTFSWSFDIK